MVDWTHHKQSAYVKPIHGGKSKRYYVDNIDTYHQRSAVANVVQQTISEAYESIQIITRPNQHALFLITR